MSYFRRAFLFACIAALGACGFTPVYAPGGVGENLRNTILLAEPDSRNEFVFVAQIEQRLGRAQEPAYAMNYTITTRSEGVGVTPTQETTRYNLFGKVSYEIIDRSNGEKISGGTVENFTGYSATSLIVGTQSVTRDANQRLMVILADQVVARLIATSRDWLR